MNEAPHSNDQLPRAVRLQQWKKQMGLGVPPIGEVRSCANCMKQVEVKPESWMLPRLKHSDAVLICDGCAVPHLPPAGEPEPERAAADLWSSAPGTGATQEHTGEPPAGDPVPAQEASTGEPHRAQEGGGEPAPTPEQPSIATEHTLQGLIRLDADMQASLRIESPDDVTRILQRLHQAVTAAEFLRTTPNGQPPALLTNTLDFIVGLDDHCVIVFLQRDLEKPEPSSAAGGSQPEGARAEDKPS